MAGSLSYVLLGDASGLMKACAAAYAGLAKIGQGVKSIAGAITGTDGSLTGLFQKSIMGAADIETVAAAFQTLTKSMGAANGLMKDLKGFAAETPFEFPELASAAKKLLAFKGSAGSVVAELRRIGDVSSLLGEPLGDIAELYGKARVQGRLFMEDVNQLTNRAVPVIQEFARQFGVADGDVRKLVESGKIGFPQLEQAFKSLTSESGSFFEGMKKQSQTFNGLWSTFKDNVQETLREFGTPVLGQLKISLKDAIGQSGQLVGYAQKWGQEMAVVLGTMRELFNTGGLSNAFTAGIKLGLADAMNFLGKAMAALAASFGGALMGAIRGAFTNNDTMWDGLADGMKAMFDHSMGKLDGKELINTSGMRVDFLDAITPAMSKVRTDMAEAAKEFQAAMNTIELPKQMMLPVQAAFNLQKGFSNRIADVGGTIGNGGPAGMSRSLEKAAQETAKEVKASKTVLKEIAKNTKPRQSGSPRF